MTFKPPLYATDDAWESEYGEFVREEDCDKAVQDAYQRGYLAGFNAHARAAQHWQDTHGAYRQHGQGENP